MQIPYLYSLFIDTHVRSTHIRSSLTLLSFVLFPVVWRRGLGASGGDVHVHGAELQQAEGDGPVAVDPGAQPAVEDHGHAAHLADSRPTDAAQPRILPAGSFSIIYSIYPICCVEVKLVGSGIEQVLIMDILKF